MGDFPSRGQDVTPPTPCRRPHITYPILGSYSADPNKYRVYNLDPMTATFNALPMNGGETGDGREYAGEVRDMA